MRKFVAVLQSMSAQATDQQGQQHARETRIDTYNGAWSSIAGKEELVEYSLTPAVAESRRFDQSPGHSVPEDRSKGRDSIKPHGVIERLLVLIFLGLCARLEN